MTTEQTTIKVLEVLKGHTVAEVNEILITVKNNLSHNAIIQTAEVKIK